MSEVRRKRLLELDANGDSLFPYVRAAETDLRKTFERLKEEAKAAEPVKESAVVKPLRKVK